jgi:UDP-2-acetamido-3-amino-2,3-dideoxy-glucuronate N-acetyltransferase
MSEYYIDPTAIIDRDVQIGVETKVWHFTHIMSGVSIGRNCSIAQNCYIGKNVTVGNGVKIQNNVSLYEGVIVADDVFIGPSVVFTNVINPRSFINRKEEYKVTNIKNGATIGANATLICGITIGEFSFIGAGAVVTKDVPPHALLVGNPAKIQGWVSHYGHKLQFDLQNIAICPQSGTKYKLENNSLNTL